MAQTVEFRLNLSVDGKEHVISTSEDVKQLAKEIGIAKDSGENLRDTLLTFNNITASFQNAARGIQELTGTLLDLTDAYATQQVNETRLANNMRNTMDAREEDIQSIKDLCAAQQELGVIGDEVQEQILKFGSEEERAAVQVIESLFCVFSSCQSIIYGH